MTNVFEKIKKSLDTPRPNYIKPFMSVHYVI
jgi:hypothetical protein